MNEGAFIVNLLINDDGSTFVGGTLHRLHQKLDLPTSQDRLERCF